MKRWKLYGVIVSLLPILAGCSHQQDSASGVSTQSAPSATQQAADAQQAEARKAAEAQQAAAQQQAAQAALQGKN